MKTPKAKKIGIVGLGYVGLPLAELFSKKYPVIGFDTDIRKIESLSRSAEQKEGSDGIDFSGADIEFVSEECRLGEADFIIVAVPTPVDSCRKPDFGDLMDASMRIGRNLSRGTTVVYESTVYPGATEEICIPILEKYSGLTCGQDFYVGYSPERINPGDSMHGPAQVVKLVSAADEETLERLSDIYGSVIEAGVYRVSSIRAAEAAKIMENTQRDINIAFMNEMSILLETLGIDQEEVWKAASTKWNSLDFRPGLVGGHCIAVDPYYLIEKGNDAGFDMQLVKAARRVNESMSDHVVKKILERLRETGEELSGLKVAVLGITFKEDVTDTRNSQSLEMIRKLLAAGVTVIVSDPRAEAEVPNTPSENIREADIVVLAVAHREYRLMSAESLKHMLKANRNLVFDLQNLFTDRECRRAGLERIGL